MNIGSKTTYVCEIQDGGAKPSFVVIAADDPQGPIIRDSSTGCWIEICKRINDLQGNKKQNVTVSGPERFGLAEPNVIKLIQILPYAERCEKYIPKAFGK